MNKPGEEDQLVAHIWLELEASTQRLDELTVARLRASRARALDAAGAKRPFDSRRWMMPLAGTATAMVAIMAVLLVNMPAPEDTMLSVAGDIELLSAAASLELLAELEFYEWLATATPDAG